MTSPEESVLLAQARKNDQEAFAALAERYEKALENIVLPLVGDRDLARDIVRETVFRAQRKLHLYREQYRFSTWFFRIGVNLAITNRRRRLLEQRLLVSEGVDRGYRDMDGDGLIGNSRWACGTNCFLHNSPVLNTTDVDGFRSNHLGGVHGLYGDAHVSFMADGTLPDVLKAVCTKAGGEPSAEVP